MCCNSRPGLWFALLPSVVTSVLLVVSQGGCSKPAADVVVLPGSETAVEASPVVAPSSEGDAATAAPPAIPPRRRTSTQIDEQATLPVSVTRQEVASEPDEAAESVETTESVVAPPDVVFQPATTTETTTSPIIDAEPEVVVEPSSEPTPAESEETPVAAPAIAEPTEDNGTVNDKTESDVEETPTGYDLMLQNPTSYPVAFLLDGKVHKINAGESATFHHESAVWTIRFHRGSNFGEAIHRLDPGTYRFDVQRLSGWQIDRQ